MPKFPRLIDLLALAFVAATITILLQPAFAPAVDWLQAIIAGKNLLAVIVLLFVLFAGGIHLLAHMGTVRFAHLANEKKYPSIIWSALIAGLLVVGFNFIRPSEYDTWTSLDALCLAICFAVSYALLCGVSYVSQRQDNRRKAKGPDDQKMSTVPMTSIFQTTPEETLKKLTENPALLGAWQKSDGPIDEPENDLFGVGYLVDRLSKSIIDDSQRTVGLLGPHGSGKTSVINLAKAKVDKEIKQISFIQVDTWGTSPGSLQSAMLRSAIRGMSRYVDTSGLGGLPKQYAQAMGTFTPNWFQALFSGEQVEPLQYLERINDVLEALGRTIIFVIEDLDRNTQGEDLRRQYLALQALLDRLNKCNRLNFILAVGEEVLDFDRLCRVKISIPRQPTDQVGAVVQAARYRLLKESLNEDVILPDWTGKKIGTLRQKLPQTSWALLRDRGSYGIDQSMPWKHVLPLLDVPRRLKTMLRHLDIAWKKLQGEITFDELLILETIRSCAPEVVDAISNIRGRDQFQKNRDNKENEASWEKQRLEEALTNVSDSDAEHLRPLADHLCNNEIENDGRRFVFSSDHQPVQSVQQDIGGNEYWQRLRNGYPSKLGPSDQYVLHSIVEWKENQDSIELVDKMETEQGFMQIFERLVNKENHLNPELRIATKELLSIASAANEELCRRLVSQASQERSLAFTALWRMISNRSSLKTDILSDWLKSEITRCLPVSLSIVRDLISSWEYIAEKRIHTLDMPSVHRFLLDLAKKSWTNDASVFLNALASKSLKDVFVLAHLIEKPASQNWSWIIPVISRSLDEAPSRIVPLAAALALGGQRNPIPPEEGETWSVTAELNHNRACDLLPKQEERLQFFKAVLSELMQSNAASNETDWDDLVKAWVGQAIITMEKWVVDGVPCPDHNPSTE